jgi:hypothetical protein
MDQRWVMGALAIVRDLVVIITAGIGSYVALAGLSTWKRQLKGQTDHELARRILVTLYRYRDAINGVRHPAMFGNEFSEPPEDKRNAMSSAQIRFYGLANVYRKRWDRVQNQRVELDAELLEAEAIWGAELKTEIFPSVFDLEWEVQVCVRNHLKMNDPAENAETKRVIDKIKKSKRDVLYDALEKQGDEFSNDFARAVGNIEKFLKPKLGRD